MMNESLLWSPCMYMYTSVAHTHLQVYKSQALDEHAALATIRQQVSDEVKSFKADLRRTAKEIVTNTETDAEVNTTKLQEQLAALERQICMIIEEYRDQKPVIEARLSSLGK